MECLQEDAFWWKLLRLLDEKKNNYWCWYRRKKNYDKISFKVSKGSQCERVETIIWGRITQRKIWRREAFGRRATWKRKISKRSSEEERQRTTSIIVIKIVEIGNSWISSKKERA